MMVEEDTRGRERLVGLEIHPSCWSQRNILSAVATSMGVCPGGLVPSCNVARKFCVTFHRVCVTETVACVASIKVCVTCHRPCVTARAGRVTRIGRKGKRIGKGVW